MALIRVINPNSNQDVTDGLAKSLAPYAIAGKLEIRCETIESGPYGIESQQDIDAVALPLLHRMQARPADAHVIACYSDPGLALCRAEIAEPVFGIMECAIAMALARGGRFGVVALSETSIERHLKAIERMGLTARLAGERPVGVSVAESASDDALSGLLSAGRLLRNEDGADVVILGCAGMAGHRARIEQDLGVPVIDPTQAAVSIAAGALLAANPA